jgi:hypothetical protein
MHEPRCEARELETLVTRTFVRRPLHIIKNCRQLKRSTLSVYSLMRVPLRAKVEEDSDDDM